MVGVFLVVPNLSAFLQNNLGLPRERLGFLYLVGGLASLVANRLVGSLVDRFGAAPSVLGGTVAFGLALYFTFIDSVTVGNLAWVFCLLMVSATLRAVPMQSLATRVPRAAQRARFMSAQNAVQHLSSAAGAFGASLGLSADSAGRLSGMNHVALVAIGISLFVPLLAGVIERGVKAREAVPS
jgi:predicted MFS family arabinose efflux permease